MRAALMTLMIGLKYPPAPLPGLTADWSRRGLGLSDVPPLVPALASRFSFTNTYYHQFPRLDIARPPDDLLGQIEFIVCSDVLEHVPPPLDAALAGLFACLEPGGFAVITVPVGGEATDEYYPGLTDVEVATSPAGEVVRWTDAAGIRHTDTAPEMHGGAGLTLAFRSFSARDVRSRLLAAGFVSVWEPPPMPELGVPHVANPGIFLSHKSPTASKGERAARVGRTTVR